MCRILIRFDIAVNADHKNCDRGKSNGTTENPEPDAEHDHVAEVVEKHEQTCHLRFEQVEVNRVEENVAGSGRSTNERRPVPPVVFTVQQKVRRHDGNTSS